MSHAVLVTEQVKPGGKRSHVVALAAGLEAIGWKATVVDWGCFSPLERLWVVGPVRVLDAAHRGLGHRWIVPALERRFASRLRALERGGVPEVVNLQEPLYLPRIRRATAAPIVLTVHGPVHREIAGGYGLLLDDPTVRWIRALEAESYRNADAVVSVDRAHADYVRSFAPGARVSVIPNFVDTRRFHPGLRPEPFPDEVERWIAGRPVVLCPRLLVPKNGVDVAIDAAAVLRDRSVSVAFVLAGHGPQRAVLEARAHERGVEDSVRFIGSAPPERMPGWCRRSFVVVVPSVSHKGVEEATSIAALEGSASARPVVASRLGGLPEVIADGESGLLVPPGDARALAEALATLVADPAAAERMGAAGARRIAAEHSHEVAARRYAEIYRTVAA